MIMKSSAFARRNVDKALIKAMLSTIKREAIRQKIWDDFCLYGIEEGVFSLVEQQLLEIDAMLSFKSGHKQDFASTRKVLFSEPCFMLFFKHGLIEKKTELEQRPRVRPSNVRMYLETVEVYLAFIENQLARIRAVNSFM